MLTIREATPEDLYFVHASWFRSWWEHDPFDSGYEQYRDNAPQFIRRRIESNQTLVVAFEAAPTEVLAWACRGVDVLHWCYTKHPYRHQQLAARLTKNITTYTLRPRLPPAKALCAKWQYNPWPNVRT